MATTLQPAVVPSALPDSGAQLSALLTGAGIAPLDEIGWIRVTGEDRVRWLNGMVTNSIQDLAPGEGCYNFVLNAQGRIQGDLTAFALPDSLLLETDRQRLPALIALLDHFIIMDDVELTDVSEQRKGIVVAGPQAIATLQAIDLPIETFSTLHLQTTSWNGSSVDIIHAHSPVVDRYELWADPVTNGILTRELMATATLVLPDAFEHLRVLEGTPRYGIDIRNSETARDLPQETGQTRALHFTKGCYLGQEIVERIRSRGNVHRTFTGFQLTGALPAAGTALEGDSDAKAVGELTSVASIPLASGPVQLALGYIRREALERNLPLTYPGGAATPITLPWSPG